MRIVRERKGVGLGDRDGMPRDGEGRRLCACCPEEPDVRPEAAGEEDASDEAP
jgi:hypothetical protein